MILYHFVGEAGFKALQQRGRLDGYARRADRYHLPAYAWMANQMLGRIGPPPGNSKYPVWAWHTWYGTKACPDLRFSAHLPPGTMGYRLTLDVPDDRVVLSDFNRWHYCLNGWYLPRSAADDKRAEALAEKLGPSEWQALKEKSWQQIFDLSPPSSTTKYLGPVDSVQATLWRIDLDMLVRAQAFTAK